MPLIGASAFARVNPDARKIVRLNRLVDVPVILAQEVHPAVGLAALSTHRDRRDDDAGVHPVRPRPLSPKMSTLPAGQATAA